MRKLTPYQVRHIYFHETNDHGAVVPRTVGEATRPETDEERIRARWKERWGLNAEQLDAKWAEFLQVEGYRSHLLRQGGRKPEDVEQAVRDFERRLVAER